MMLDSQGIPSVEDVIPFRTVAMYTDIYFS
jgi:hypothetical protein